MRYFVQPFDKPSHQGLQSPSDLRKRKRSIDDDDDEDSDIANDSSSPPTRSSSHSYHVKPSMSRDLVHQYKTAGQPLNEDAPGGGFPHKPLPNDRKTTNRLSLVDLKAELASLKPPLIHGDGQQDDHLTTLKRRQLAVLTAIMHRCLLQGDYIRAGRALGMILRTEVGGVRPNIKSHGLWGIGAEILLQAEGQVAGIRAGRLADETLHGDGGKQQDRDLQAVGGVTAPNFGFFTQDGFDKAKAYYERLIVEFPYRAWLADRLSALHLYPAIFGLWISFVDEQHGRTVAALARQEGSGDAEDGDSDSDAAEGAYENSEELRKSILQRAEEIARRIDDVLIPFPYSDDPTLWKLKGMITLWIGDLSVVQLPKALASTGLTDNETSSRPGLIQDDEEHESEPRQAYMRSLVVKEKHVEKAEEAFEKAKKLEQNKATPDDAD